MVKYSKQQIFWNTSDNVPSKIAFDKYKAKMIEDNNETLKVNFRNYNFVEVVSKDKDIKYIWVNHNGMDYFYYITGIQKVLVSGFVLNCSLDIYTTYMIGFIEKMKDAKQEVEVIRSHKIDDKSGQFDDEQLQNAFIEYETIQPNKFLYNKQEIDNNNYWFNNELVIKNPDYNANKYYVFNEGDNGSYTFIPLVKNNEDLIIHIKESSILDKPSQTFLYQPNLFGGYKWSGDDGFKRCIDINQKEYTQYEIDNIVRDAYREGKKVVYQLRSQRKELANMENWRDNIYNFNENNTPWVWYTITNGTNAKLPSSFSFKNWSKYDARVGRDDYAIPFLDNIEITSNLKGYNRPSSFFQQFDSDRLRSVMSMCVIKILIYDTIDKFGPEHPVKNRKDILEQMKYSEEYSNKFVGLFYLPNILSVESNILIKDIVFTPKGESSPKTYSMLILDLEAEGIFINNFPIFQWNYDKRWWLLNNANYTSKNILKLININYFNNNIDGSIRASEFFEGPNTIYLGGYMYFTSNGILISKPPLLNLQNSIINFPFQLPSGTDEYLNYVNSTKNSVETSYNITKQNAVKESIFGSLSGISQIVGGVGKMLNPLNVINPSGAVQGAAQSFQGAVNIAKSITDGVLSVKQKEQQIRAKYADKNNQLGNQLAPANVIDSMWAVYNVGNDQFELVEIKNLTESSLKALNNVIVLYGEFYPRIEDINEVWNVEGVNESKYRYLSLSANYLEKIYYRYSENIPLEFKETIISLLEQGLRFWDVETPFFDDWTGDVPTIPDNPDNEGPVIPKPPIETEIIIQVKDYPDNYPEFTKLSSNWTQTNVPSFVESFMLDITESGVSYNMNNGERPSSITVYSRISTETFPNIITIDCKNKDFWFPYKTGSNFNFCIIDILNDESPVYLNLKRINLINVSEQGIELIKSISWKSCISWYGKKPNETLDFNFNVAVYINGEKFI